ncbi:MAG: hypothetical protein FH753_18485 [Firmicutes bacterium]|nr:hypothetical protein [Bacillota bacterium]
MALKAGFIFLSPEADPKVDRSTIKTESINIVTIGVADYKMACEVAKELLDQDIKAIELCGGFGNEGVSLVTKAIKGKVPIGVVRFDIHPGLENRSGDIVFNKEAIK